MKNSYLLICAMASCASGLIAFGQETVSSPTKRQAALEEAAQLVAPRNSVVSALPAELVDPFNPVGFGAPPARGKKGDAAHTPTSDREILENVATRITPSGMMMFGDQPMLLFREKKLKVGDNLTITFDGADYVVVITAIDRTSFKIRFNREEVTRPIKSGKVP